MGIEDREYYRDDEPGIRLGGTRTMVTNLMIVTIGIFFLDAFTGETSYGSNWLAYTLSLKSNLLQQPWNFWQLLTNGFAHASINSRASIWHVAGNMFILWMFGRSVEPRYGRYEFLRFYLLAIVVASSAWLALHVATQRGQASEGHVVHLLGASGAVTAVLIVYVFNWPKRTLLLMGVVPIPAWLLGVLWVVSDMMGQVNGKDNIAYTAHLAGAGFGAAYFLLNWNLGRILPDRFFNFKKALSRRPPLKVHDPEQFYEDRDQEADRVLQKLHTKGEDSLTPKERRILEDYSRRMRQKHR